jgi:hypothetical protein
MINKCTNQECPENGSDHTHNTPDKEACEYPFKEETPPPSSEAVRWWLNRFEESKEDGLDEEKDDHEIIVAKP